MSELQIDAKTTLQRADGVVHGDLPEESVLLDIEDGAAVRLNASGAWLWGQLEEPTPVEDLAQGLAGHFEIDGERALGDVVAFAREMTRRGLLATA